MHEASLALSLMDIVEEVAAKEDARRVRGIEIELGALSCVEPEAFLTAIESAAAGRIGEGADVRLIRPAGQAHCMGCGDDVTLDQRGAPCPHCGSYSLLVTGGDGMRLVAIEVV
jgi:hydrogenase nickel incorporation protein HypA/HybF